MSRSFRLGGTTTKASTDQRTITTPRTIANQPKAPDTVSLVVTEAMLSVAPAEPSVWTLGGWRQRASASGCPDDLLGYTADDIEVCASSYGIGK